MVFHALTLTLLFASPVRVALGVEKAAAPDTAAVEREASVAADLPSCGGVGALASWAADGAAESDLSVAPDALHADGAFGAQGRLVRAFALSAATSVRLEAAAVPSGDPYLSVFDEAGNEVAADDDGGGHGAARIETVLPAGRYCALARGYDNAAMSVALRLGRVEHAPLTAGVGDGSNPGCEVAEPARLSEAPLDADALAGGVAMTATAVAVPAWRFELAEPAALSITARSPGGDPSLRLLERTESRVLAENDDSDGLDSRIELAGELPAGSYCLEVSQLNEDALPVTVRVAAFDRAASRLRGIDAGELSPLPDDDVAVRELGALDGVLVADVFASGTKAAWVRFEMPEDGLVVLEAVGGRLDPAVVLFDRAGRRIAENDDGPDASGGPSGRDSFLARRLSAGSYQLAVRAIGETGTGNVRVLLERYVAAR